jgi:hypothetical protein
MKTNQLPCTFFGTYRSRLCALAAKHDLKTDALKSLIDVALFRCSGDAKSQSRDALSPLAQHKIGFREINFLFSYRAVQK